MDGDMQRKPIYFPNVLIICFIILLMACAGEQNVRANRDPILGEWINDKGVATVIHRLPGNELVAEVISAPGFFGNDIGAGKMIIRNIQSFQTRYSGIFVMPGEEKSVRVQIRFRDMNTLVFSTDDKRAKGNLMVWRRVKSNKLMPK
jgi:hypothetical protein